MSPCHRPSISDTSGNLNSSALISSDIEPRLFKSQRSTPRKATSNTSRRRDAIQNLARNEATPSHLVKMACMFQEAAVEIERTQASSMFHSRCLPVAFDSPHCKRPVILRSFAQEIRPRLEESVHKQGKRSQSRDKSPQSPMIRASTPPDLQFERIFPTPPLPLMTLSPHTPIKGTALEPLSSGFAALGGSESQAPDERAAVSLTIYQDSDEDDCHSSHGVPYIIVPKEPYSSLPRRRLNIDAWLDEITDPVSDPAPATKAETGARIISSIDETIGLGSSPTPCSVSKRVKVFTTSTGPRRRPSRMLAVTDHRSHFLSALPRKPNYRSVIDGVRLLNSPPRHASNKENRPPPTLALSWCSSASPPDQKIPALDEEFRTVASAMFPPLACHGGHEMGPHPTFSTPTTLCSSTHRKKLKFSSPAAKALPAAEVCRRSGSSSSNEIGKQRTSCASDQGTAAEQHTDGKILPLSPGVECFRKGKGPRRDRCTSYWDGDIVPDFSPWRRATNVELTDKVDDAVRQKTAQVFR
ncbi:hypothetical protein MMC13_003236 [Lambiella insularis]|nr:hypothetical protein [Lambiella insularis]